MVGRPLSWGGDGAARSCCGLADIPGKGLDEALRAPSARVSPGLRGYLRQEPCRGLVGVLDKEPRCRLVLWFLSRPCRPFVFTKIYMPPRRCLPSPGPTGMMALETVGSRVACSAGVRQVAPARILPRLRKPPRQQFCRGSPPRPLALFASLVLHCSGIPPLPCLVWPWTRL